LFTIKEFHVSKRSIPISQFAKTGSVIGYDANDDNISGTRGAIWFEVCSIQKNTMSVADGAPLDIVVENRVSKIVA
jgi:hypothetical protein